jgi:hypothetical protein
MTLREYLEWRDLTDEDFARQLAAVGAPVERSAVTRWSLSETTPKPRYIRAIVMVTKGKVSALDLLATNPRKRQRKAA